MKRQLTDVEKGLCKKSIAGLKEDIKYDEAMVKYYTLQIEELLPLNFERKTKEFKDMLRQLHTEVDMIKNIITETEKQMKEGVEEKNEKEKSGTI